MTPSHNNIIKDEDQSMKKNKQTQKQQQNTQLLE